MILVLDGPVSTPALYPAHADREANCRRTVAFRASGCELAAVSSASRGKLRAGARTDETGERDEILSAMPINRKHWSRSIGPGGRDRPVRVAECI
jgi:hypothetical protein